MDGKSTPRKKNVTSLFVRKNKAACELHHVKQGSAVPPSSSLTDGRWSRSNSGDYSTVRMATYFAKVVTWSVRKLRITRWLLVKGIKLTSIFIITRWQLIAR